MFLKSMCGSYSPNYIMVVCETGIIHLWVLITCLCELFCLAYINTSLQSKITYLIFFSSIL